MELEKHYEEEKYRVNYNNEADANKAGTNVVKKGIIKKLNEDKYNLSCIICGDKHDLSIYPHRNEEGTMVGLIYVCNRCYYSIEKNYYTNLKLNLSYEKKSVYPVGLRKA